MRFVKLAGTAFVAALIMWGCNETNNQDRPQPQRSIEDNGGRAPAEQDQAREQQATPSGEADEYGRMPGDEHYGHDHPPQGQQQNNQVQPGNPGQTQQAPQDGEPDEYGRMPGDEHYGHDHPPLDQQQNNQAQPGSPMQQGTPVQPQQSAPADGEPDKYGRMPGDEHYGHDHPPQDEE